MWSGSAGLTVLPVNYVATTARILLRTAAYASVARECRDNEVAFLVNDIDEDTYTGCEACWFRGRCRDAEPNDIPDQDVWAPGTRRVLFAIEAREVTGRRLGSSLEASLERRVLGVLD